MEPRIIHLIPNAHLDPVWMWDWREGFTEMLTTTRTILDLMDEYPDLTFVRGEAFVYRHIEQSDPQLFARVQNMIAAGRWDVVGGTMLQGDMNLPATETLLRHLVYAQRYFQERFGRTARAGWSADCFGHSVHLPDLLSAAGLEYYAYTRPSNVPPQSTFWWIGPAGARLLVHHPALGWYGSERHETRGRLDGLLQQAQDGTQRNLACFFGLGNHGGQPTRRQIAEAQEWAAEHPAVQVRFSSLTGFFDALRQEVESSGSGLPEYQGELNFTTRGVYAATARFKYPFRRTEALLSRAERTASLAAIATGQPGYNLRAAWEALLFNTFHDILPGSSGERPYDEQIDWLGSAAHSARLAEQQAVLQLSRRIDTRVRPVSGDYPTGVPILVINPHPWAYQGPLELEACLDYRPIWKYTAEPESLPMTVRDPQAGPLAIQRIAGGNLYGMQLNLRNQVVTQVQIPAYGWKLLEFAYEEGAPVVPTAQPTRAETWDTGAAIGNETWQVQAERGANGIRITREGQPLLGDPGLGFLTVEDPWGSWGDFQESPASTDLNEVRLQWRITRVEVGESGPLRSTLNVRFEGGQSSLDLRLALSGGRNALDVSARVLWNERSARLKLCLPGQFSEAVYDVMGGSIRRGALGEVPGGRWVRLESGEQALGFASDALYGFNLTQAGALQATIARATRYSSEGPAQVDEQPWFPVVDRGELRLRFLLTAGSTPAMRSQLEQLADELEQPPLTAHVVPSGGDWPPTGSLLGLAPAGLRLLALKPAEEQPGWVLHLQSQSAQAISPVLTWLGQTLSLASVPPGKVAVYRLRQSADGTWAAQPVNLLEHSID